MKFYLKKSEPHLQKQIMEIRTTQKDKYNIQYVH